MATYTIAILIKCWNLPVNSKIKHISEYNEELIGRIEILLFLNIVMAVLQVQVVVVKEVLLNSYHRNLIIMKNLLFYFLTYLPQLVILKIHYLELTKKATIQKTFLIFHVEELSNAQKHSTLF